MKLAKPLVLGGMVAIMLALVGWLFQVSEMSAARDLAERIVLFRDHSYRSVPELRACLLEQRHGGLALTEPERGLFGKPSEDLVNQARHTLVRIENRGDFRIIRAWRRGETTLRPGEILHLLQCLDRPAG